MTSAPSFGDPVEVTAISHRVTRQTENRGSWVDRRYEVTHFHFARGGPYGPPPPEVLATAEWPERIDGQTHVRICRAVCDPAVGIVVGRTYRAEGRLERGDEESPPYLDETRRVSVYQVALRSGRAAKVVLVQPDDLRPVDGLDRPTPPPVLDGQLEAFPAGDIPAAGDRGWVGDA